MGILIIALLPPCVMPRSGGVLPCLPLTVVYIAGPLKHDQSWRVRCITLCSFLDKQVTYQDCRKKPVLITVFDKQNIKDMSS